MRTRQGVVLQSLRRARGFLDANDAVLGLAKSETRKTLDEVIGQLSDQAALQDTGARGSRGETEKQRVTRSALRQYHMRPISGVAMLRLRDVPEFSSLRMPHPQAKAEQLIAAAAAMSAAAQPYESVFIANGLAPSFLADLRAAADALRISIDGRGEHRRKRSGATAGLITNERRGRTVLRVLDGLVRSRIPHDDQLLGEWTAARRIRRSPTTQPEEFVAVTPRVTVS